MAHHPVPLPDVDPEVAARYHDKPVGVLQALTAIRRSLKVLVTRLDLAAALQMSRLYLGNLDRAGKGPKGRLRSGRGRNCRTYYRRDWSALDFIADRLDLVDQGAKGEATAEGEGA